ncbi:MAG: TonB-dependent receptor, partial [Bacteroidota bacterium]
SSDLLNVNTYAKVSDKWSTAVLGHAEWNNQRMDNNNDGFLDNPLKEDVVFRNEWHLNAPSGVHGKYQITALGTKMVGGQTGVNRSGEQLPNVWGMSKNTERVEASAKTSYNLKRQSWKGFGSQISGVYHDQDMKFGSRVYKGTQRNFRGSILYHSIFGNTNHQFLTGASFVYDEYQESLDSIEWNRTERVPGGFFEYTWNNIERFTLVAGGRIDYHNQYGVFYSPRVHFRYSLNELNSIKLSAGKGYRISNVIMENVGRLASNREFTILNSDDFGFGLEPEEAWSFGVNYVNKFRLNYRDASFSADFYQTQFENQTVVDLDQSSRQVLVYNLPGQSWSSSAQAEFAWSPRRRLDVRLAYRWLDVQTDYLGERRFAPFISKHRGFITAGYKTKPGDKKAHWRLDGTLQWIGSQRLPVTTDNDAEFQLDKKSDDFLQLNAQITRAFNPDFEVYLGVENALNFRQENPIISAQDPFREEFDASMIWGPVFGRMVFFGLRYSIQREEP